MAKKNPKLTEEEKNRFAPILRNVWQYIGQDADELIPQRGPRRVSSIVELVCDANRPSTIGKMSREDENRLAECYFTNDTQKWLRGLFHHY